MQQLKPYLPNSNCKHAGYCPRFSYTFFTSNEVVIIFYRDKGTFDNQLNNLCARTQLNWSNDKQNLIHFFKVMALFLEALRKYSNVREQNLLPCNLLICCLVVGLTANFS